MLGISRTISSHRVLNPRLYQAIQKALSEGKLTGDLTVKHPGERLQIRHVQEPGGRIRTEPLNVGERYDINCPFCGDTRNRLSISHAWGETDHKTGRPNFWAFRCYNEECQRTHEGATGEMIRILHAPQLAPMAASPGAGAQTVVNLEEAMAPPDPALLPRDIHSLHELPDDHPAVRFFRDHRGLDPMMLSDVWGARYCSSRFPAQAHNRVLFPLFLRGEYRGYQARYIGDGDGDNKYKMFCRNDDCHHIWPVGRGVSPRDALCPSCGMRDAEKVQKWWNGKNTRNSQLLYNFDAASQWPYVVLCEGPLDPIYVGTPDHRGVPGPAVASYGKSLSYPQLELMLSVPAWRGAPVYLAYDGEVWHDPDSERGVVKLLDRLTSSGFQAVPVLFPYKKDPGDLPHEQVWQTIRSCSEDYGIKPPF